MRIVLDTAYPEIIEECCAALESVFPAKTVRAATQSVSGGTRPSDRQIAIYRKASVALLDEFVGPKQ